MLREQFRGFITKLSRLWMKFFKRQRKNLGLPDSELASKLYPNRLSKRKKIGDEYFPAMPKRQPCPRCGKWSPRIDRTPGGARYGHRAHQPFFVYASGMEPKPLRSPHKALRAGVKGMRQDTLRPGGKVAEHTETKRTARMETG